MTEHDTTTVDLIVAGDDMYRAAQAVLHAQPHQMTEKARVLEEAMARWSNAQSAAIRGRKF